MSVEFIDAIGPYLVIVGVATACAMLLAGFVLDWIRAHTVGPGPLNGKPQIPS